MRVTVPATASHSVPDRMSQPSQSSGGACHETAGWYGTFQSGRAVPAPRKSPAPTAAKTSAGYRFGLGATDRPPRPLTMRLRAVSVRRDPASRPEDPMTPEPDEASVEPVLTALPRVNAS